MCKISGHNARLLLPIVALISGLVAYSYGDTKISGTPSIVIFRDRKAAEEKFQKAANIVEAKCTEYNEKIYKIIQVSTLPGCRPSFIKELDCKASKPLIVGGIEAEPKEFPHMALLGYINGEKIDWRCGGSLISDRFVMSAAHCEPNESARPELVLLGELDYSRNNDDARPTYYKIVERFKHPLYSPPKKVNDIILYKLNAGKPSGALMRATVDIFDNKFCEFAFRNHTFYPDGVDEDAIICAGNKDRRDAETCPGDSGGPLQISTGTCLWKQLGIVSTWPNIRGDTANSGVIYTRVARYIEWIQSIVWSQTK